jgi:hypothetical protein
MHDPARQALEQVMSEYGVSILDTPRILATLLRQHARLVPHDVDALLAAVDNGVTAQIRDNPQHDPESLARVLMQCAKLGPVKAECSVRTWTTVLASAAKPREPEPKSATTRVVAVLFGAAAVGTLAYFVYAR